MTSHLRTGAGLLAATLLFLLSPGSIGAITFPDDVVQRAHPWKLAYAKRMAEEPFGMERRERVARLRELALKARRTGKSQPGAAPGQRARPAAPRGLPLAAPDGGVARVHARPSGALAITPPTNVIVNDRAGDVGSAGQSETSIVGFGNRLVAAWNDGQGFATGGDSQGWATSTDGGQTWIDQGDLPHPSGLSGFAWFSDPVLAVNEKTGAIYFSALTIHFVSGEERSGIGVVKGRFNGNTFTWGTPVIARHLPFASQQLDKQWIVADSVSHRVFMSYSQFSSTGSQIEFQWADSALSAFAAPQLISLNNSNENGWVQGSRPIVDGDGRVFVMYNLIGQSYEDFYRVARSTNSGTSFSPPATAVTLYTNFGTGAPGFNRPNGVQFASIAADRSHGPVRNRLYLTWAESINWLDDLLGIGQLGNKTEVEPNNSSANATPASVGQTVRGTISAVSDADYFAIPLLAGQHLIAGADSVQAGAVLTLDLVAGDGVSQLAFTEFNATVNPNPQAPNGAPAGWMFTAPVNGTYYLRIGWETAGFGSYRVRIGQADQAGERGRDQRDVFTAWSDDGTSWSSPVRVNEDAVGFDDWLPELAVAPDGGLYGAWYDFSQAAPASNGAESHVVLARSGDGAGTWTVLGAVSDTLSRWSAAFSNIQPNQGDYIALFANASHVLPVWADVRRGNPDVFTGRVPLIPNGTQVAFDAVRLAPKRISIDWQATPPDTLTMRLYRSVDAGLFAYHDLVSFDTGGQLTYDDTTVVAEHAYSYRLGRFVNGVEIFHGYVSVFLPNLFPLLLSLPVYPITGNSFAVNFSLATDGPAELALFDISGRERWKRAVNLGQGGHSLTLPVDPDLRQGLYVLRLRQGDRKASTRFALVR